MKEGFIMAAIKNYVEEVIIDHFVESHIAEIKSIDDYLSTTKFGPHLLGFRFFQTEKRVIDGETFTSDPKNFSDWISNNQYDDFDEVTLQDGRDIKWSDHVKVQDFILALNGATPDAPKDQTGGVKGYKSL